MIAIPISTAAARGSSIANKVIYETILNKYNKNKEQCGKDQQTTKSLDKFYRKPLHDYKIDKMEYESLYNRFTKYVDENKNESFLKT